MKTRIIPRIGKYQNNAKKKKVVISLFQKCKLLKIPCLGNQHLVYLMIQNITVYKIYDLASYELGQIIKNKKI